MKATKSNWHLSLLVILLLRRALGLWAYLSTLSVASDQNTNYNYYNLQTASYY